MGLLTQVFNPRPMATLADSRTQYGDFWYRDVSGYIADAGDAGIPLSADTILRCGTVLAAVRFKADCWAMCPPSTYRKTAGGRMEEPDHYSQRVLRNPNAWQTGVAWRSLNSVWMSTWGNAYNEIIGGRQAFAQELRPLHPCYVKVADQRADGSLLYRYDDPVEGQRYLGQEQVLHFRGISTDGMRGLPMYQLIRNVVGIALLSERHTAAFLKKGSRLSGLLVPNAPLKEDQRQLLKKSVNEDFGGVNNTGTFGIMPHGVDLKPVAANHRDSQFYELADQVVGNILRFLGVPGVVVGYMGDKTATYASAKEFFESGGIKHTVLPLLVNVEAEEEKSLLVEGSGLQIKHNLDALMRANMKDRTDALVKSIGGPFRTVNEGRTIEDMDRLDDPRYDEILTPSNMSPELVAPEPDALPDDAPPPPQPADAATQAKRPAAPSRLAALAREYARVNAERLVRREVKAVQAKAPRTARDKDLWRATVLELYGDEHARHVAEDMQITQEQAQAYCNRQAAALLAGGVAAAEKWEAEVVPRLMALALGEEAGA